jgi:hypothetical protein
MAAEISSTKVRSSDVSLCDCLPSGVATPEGARKRIEHLHEKLADEDEYVVSC